MHCALLTEGFIQVLSKARHDLTLDELAVLRLECEFGVWGGMQAKIDMRYWSDELRR